mgnify:FL=1
MVNKVNGTFVECNTAYNGQRNDTEKHLEVVRAHGFDKIANVDITDAEGEIAIPVALDMASVNVIDKHHSSKKDSLIKRIESLNGKHTIDVAYQLGIGNKEYELVNID